MVYFTFGDADFAAALDDLGERFVARRVCVGDLWAVVQVCRRRAGILLAESARALVCVGV